MFNSIARLVGIIFCLAILFACRDAGKAKELMQAAVTAQPEDKNIVEFFMYTCPHCRNIEANVNRWQAKQSILFQQGIYVFEQIPAIFSANWASDSKNGEAEAAIYYTLRRMGLEQRLRARVFTAIQDKSLDARNAQSISDFLQKEGIPSQEFSATLKSPEVKASLNRAEQLTRQYAVFSVPAFVLFNRKVILPQDFADNNAVETALLDSVKEHYLLRSGK